jgi:hypothetical protein
MSQAKSPRLFERWLADAGQREKMGWRGYELANGYDWRAVASGYPELYQNLLATERRAHSNCAQTNSELLQLPSKILRPGNSVNSALSRGECNRRGY